MATTKNITMKQFNGTDYDTLYPKTVYNQVSGVAPAGYGLGGGATLIGSGSDLNDYKACGWYAFDTGVANMPSEYGSCIVLNKGGSYIVHQIVVTGFGQNICIRRYYSPTDEWGAWEWVNPPMQLGVEYRTTERYLGKPVYVMMVDGLSSSAGAWKQVSGFGSNIDELVRYTATGVESTYNEIVPIPSTIGDGYKIEGGVVRTAQNNIYIIYKCNNRGLSNVKFTLYYTKTTD